MLNSTIVRTVGFCTRHMWLIIATALLLGSGSAWYASRHFAINTDISTLLSPDLPWRKHEIAHKAAFPQEAESIIAVVEGPTPELAGAAAKALTERLSGQTDLFRSVNEAGGGEFFDRNGLLYQSTGDLAHTTQRLVSVAPLVQILASDPSLRGLLQALAQGLHGVQTGSYSLDDLARPLNLAADTVENVLSGRPASFSWHVLVSGSPAKPEDLRRLIEVWPVLDYSALEPGQAAVAAIRKAAQDSKLDSAFSSAVRLTGPVPILDQEFITLRQGVALNGFVTSAIILIILWLALRSLRIVAAVAVNVLVGLAITAALGMMLVGALNPISVAFVVLFVGLGADFSIQFSVRYRAERHADDNLRQSLINAAAYVGAPLTLAAAAAAAGFLSFLPTSYRGVAELGVISGCGMAVALVASVTLLPALLRAFNPPKEPNPLGYAALAPVDRFLQRHRIAVVAGTSIIVLAALPLLLHLKFDFNPASLQDPNSEAIATLRSLGGDPRVRVNVADVLTTRSDAGAVSKRLSALPEVSQTRTLDTFIPDDQDRKLTLIQNAASSLEPALQASRRSAPSDPEEIAALRSAVTDLQKAADERSGHGPEAARRLAKDLDKLANADTASRRAVEAAFVRPLQMDLQELRQSLRPQRITQSNLPHELVRDWLTPDGRMRVEIVPKGDPNDNETISNFAPAVLAIEPTATGQAIETYEWGNSMIRAFLQAGGWAVCSIAVLLWSLSDVSATSSWRSFRSWWPQRSRWRSVP